MQYQKLEYFISQPRLDRFLHACAGSPQRTESLYQANLKVAESFYSVLNLFEVFLRNRINTELSNHFGNPDWILVEKNGFMSNASLVKSQFYLRKEVLTAEKRLIMRKKQITSGLVIAEQSLGFWTSLFDTHHYKILAGSIIHCFPNKPNNIQRKQINIILYDIRDFRNRVYHNEPICFNGSTIDFTRAIRIREDIYKILNWMDSDIADYTSKLDTIQHNIQAALQI